MPSTDRVFALQHGPKSKEVNIAAKKRNELSAEQEQTRKDLLIRLVLWYGIGSVVASVLLLMGAIGVAWYTFLVTSINTTTEQAKVDYVEDWAMGSAGLKVLTQYCTEDIGCVPDKDYYVMYNRASNLYVDWPEAYSPAVENTGTAGTFMLLHAILCVIVSVATIGIITFGIYFKLPKWLGWTCVAVNAAAAGLGVLVAYLFYATSQEVVILLKDDSVIQDTSPSMELGWAAFCSFLGSILMGAGIIPLFKAIGPVAGEAKICINTEVDLERQSRVKQYVADMINTSNLVEANPIDTAPCGHHGTGWTKTVLSMPINTVIEVDHDGTQLNTPDHVLVHGADQVPNTAEAGAKSMSCLIPSRGMETHKFNHKPDTVTPVMQITKSRFADTIPGFGMSTTAIDLVGAKQRARVVTRAPPPSDRPQIDGFVSSSGIKPKDQRYRGGLKPLATVNVTHDVAH